MSGNFKWKKTKKLWLFLGILTLTNLFIYLLPGVGETTLLYASNFLPVLCSVIAVGCLICLVRSFRQCDLTKTSWLMLLIGIAIYFLAESTYAVLEIVLQVDMNTTFPTFADWVWAAGYIPVIAGLIIMIIGYKRSGFPMGNIKLYSILLLLIMILLTVVIYFLLIPIFKDSETSGLAKFFYLFYPVADLFIVIPALLLMYITSLFGKGTISKPWKYISFGFILFTVADLLYSYLDWIGLYDSGSLLDLGWNIGYLLIGLSALYQVEIMKSVNEIE